MKSKEAQLKQWMDEIKSSVNKDGNISYGCILRLVKEKSLTQKQLDILFQKCHEEGVDIVYDEEETLDEETSPLDDEDDLFDESIDEDEDIDDDNIEEKD